MYAFLFFLGAVTTAAGLALVASVVRGHESGFDTDIITPGAIAVVGGLLLVGMGLIVRALQRIERSLAARPLARPTRPSEAPVATAEAERTKDPVPIPFPSKAKAESIPQAASGTATVPAAENPAVDRVREKFPALVRPESAPAMNETGASLLPQASSLAEDVGEVKKVANAGRTNGAAIGRSSPTLTTRPAGSPARAKGSVFEAFWPKAARARKDAEAGPKEVPLPPSPPEVSAPTAAVAPHAVEQAAPAEEPPVSIIKSGVVEGMAYTLYSDGSIEAQFSQGMLRFGSITELRNHIERNS